MDSVAVERSVWIAAPRERVWRAITEAEQIMQWWGGDHWEIEVIGWGDDARRAVADLAFDIVREDEGFAVLACAAAAKMPLVR